MSEKLKVPELRFKGFSGEWEGRELKDVLLFYSGLTYSPSDVIANGGTLVLRSSNVKNGEIISADNVYVNSFVVNSNNVQLGDIIVVVRNGSRSLIGKHAQIKKIMKDTVIGAFMTGICSSQPEFINALLDTSQYYREIEKNLGATINQITTGAFKKMHFLFPGYTEQTKIGTFFQQLDNRITLQQRKCEKLKNIKKSMLEKMFPKEGFNVPEIRFAGFTKPWGVRSLGEISNKVTEKNTQMNYSETFTNSAEFGIISQRDYFDHDITNSDNINTYYIVRNEDFIYNPRISSFAPVGPINRNKLGRIGVMSPLYSVFRTHDIDNEFLEQFFKSSYWHHFMKLNGDSGARSDRFSIKDSIFINMPIPYPSLEEQFSVGIALKNIDNLISLQNTKLEKFKNIKKSCLEKMFV